MPHRPNSLINTKNCYRTVNRFVRRKKKTLLKNGVIEGRRNRKKKEKRGRQREKFVGRKEAREGDSEGVRREKNKGKRRNERVYCEKG